MRLNRPVRGHTLPARLRHSKWDGEPSSPVSSSLPQRKRSKSCGSSFDVWSPSSWEASSTPSGAGDDHLHMDLAAAPSAIMSVEENLSYLSSSRRAADDAATMELLVRLCSEEESHEEPCSDHDGLGHDLIDIFAEPPNEASRDDYCSRASTSVTTSPVDEKLSDNHAPPAAEGEALLTVAPASVAPVMCTQAVAIPRAVPIIAAKAVPISVASASAHTSLGACASWHVPSPVQHLVREGTASQSMPTLHSSGLAAASAHLVQPASLSAGRSCLHSVATSNVRSHGNLLQWCPPSSQQAYSAPGPSYEPQLYQAPSSQPQLLPRAASTAGPGLDAHDPSCEGARCGTSPEDNAVGGGSGRNLAERVSWSPEDDAKIVAGVRMYGCKWRVIAALLPGRSDDAVRNRWNRVKDLPQHRSSSEDAEHATVAKPPKPPKVPPKAQAQKRETDTHAFSEQADQENKRDRVSWSRKEDELIIRSVEELGNKWHKIALRLPGRTEHAIRNRFARLQSLASRGRPVIIGSGRGLPIGIQLIPQQVP